MLQRLGASEAGGGPKSFEAMVRTQEARGRSCVVHAAPSTSGLEEEGRWL